MPLTDLLDEPGFRHGLVAGASLLGGFLVLALLSLRRWGPVLPVVGIAVAVGSAWALDRTGPSVMLSDRLVLGLGLLVCGPYLAAIARSRRGWAWAVTALAAIPGALLVASAASLENGLDWVPPLTVVTIVLGGALLTDYDRANARAGLAPVLLLLTAFGMYATLPDTEQAMVVLGVVLPLALVGWPVAFAALGPGAYATVGLLAWVAAVGGRGRPGAVIGGIACLGIVLVEPLVRRAWRARARVPRRPRSRLVGAMVALQAVTVAMTSRVAGLETSAVVAAAIALGVLAAATAGVAAVLVPRGPTPLEPAPDASCECDGGRPPTS